MRTEQSSKEGIATKNGEQFPLEEGYPSEFVFLEDGHWHILTWDDEWVINPITRKDVKKVVPIRSLLNELTDVEKNNLLHPTFRDTIEEVFHMKNFSWISIQEWMKDCYLLDVNPLPHIRKMLKGICDDVRFAYTGRGSFVPVKGEEFLVCWLEDDQHGFIEVYLETFEG